MFITEIFAKEYIKQYVDENISIFKNKKIVIHTVGEHGINLYELLTAHKISILAFSENEAKLIGKVIYGIPVIRMENIPDDAFIILSSSTTAKRDAQQFISMKFDAENIMEFYPTLISYYHNKFLQIDEEHYRNLTKEENEELLSKDAFNNSVVDSLPIELMLDLTQKCNLNCRHCNNHHNEEISKIRNQAENYTNPERYKFLLKYVKAIQLNISGEPLITNRFWEMLDYIDATENDIHLTTYTNGILLNKKAAERIVNSKFKVVTISMDAATNNTYKRLRHGGDFNVWMDNVRYLVKKRNEFQNYKLKIELFSTISRENLPELPLMVKVAQQLGVDILTIHPLFSYMPGKDTWIVPMDESSDFYYPQQDVTYYPNLTKKMIDEANLIAKNTSMMFRVSPRFEFCYSSRFKDIEYPNSIDKFKEEVNKQKKDQSESMERKNINIKNIEYDSSCNSPWRTSLIYSNGNIMYCCKMSVMQGNINFSSFYDLWNNPTVQNIRKGLVDKDICWDCYFSNGCDLADAVRTIERPIYYLQRGEVLDFNINNSNLLKEIKYSGISMIQREGAWNNQRTVDIEMNIRSDAKPHVFILHAEAFVIPGLVDEQRVKVYCKDKLVSEILYTDNKECQKIIQISDEFIQSSLLNIKFEFPDAISPIYLGIGRDDRERAIFFKKIEIM